MTTTATAPTDEQRIAILRHLANGKGLDVTATIVRQPREAVLDVASKHGYPDREKLAWAADLLAGKTTDARSELPDRTGEDSPRGVRVSTAPQTSRPATSTPAGREPLTKPDEIRILLNTAKAHPSKRIQNAADKVFDSLDRLRGLIREDEEKNAEKRKRDAAKAELKAKKERLEQQLAAVKAELRGKPAPTPQATDTPKRTTAPKGEYHCRNDGCDDVRDTPQGRSMHERLHCAHRTEAEAS